MFDVCWLVTHYWLMLQTKNWNSGSKREQFYACCLIVLVFFRLNMWSEKRRPCQHMNSLTFTVNWLWHGCQLLSLRSKWMRVSIIAPIDLNFFFWNDFKHDYIQILSLFHAKSNSAHSISHAIGLYVPIPDLHHSLSANLWSSSTLQC